jgi:tetratricopeptide (TPR) repeat protein
LTGLGQIERDLANGAAAREHYEAALAIYRVHGEPDAVAHTVRHLGDVLRDQGRSSDAEACYLEALAFYRRDAGRPLDLANCLRGLALLGGAQAKEHWLEARSIYAAANVEPGVRECERRIATLS